jgi:hypothetical protein
MKIFKNIDCNLIYEPKLWFYNVYCGKLFSLIFFTTENTKLLHKVHKVPFIVLLISFFSVFFVHSLRTLWLIFNYTIINKLILTNFL